MIIIPHIIDTVFIMLGFNCNYHCRYCLQHEFKNINTSIIKPPKEFFEFIHILSLKRKKNNLSPLYVHFFGGEPLLYYDVIKYIVNTLNDMQSYVQYSMITNGSLLNTKIVRYLNSNNFSVGISWDGRNSIITRKHDIIKENKENIFKLNSFNISGVISAYNYPKEFLEDIHSLNIEYYKQYNKIIPYNLDSLYDFNNKDREIFNIDFDKIYNQIKEMTHIFIYRQEKNLPVQNDFINGYMQILKSVKHEIKTFKYSSCSNGIHVLNLDLDGNLYLCHNNTEKKLGTIFDDIDYYMSNYSKYNIVPNYYKEYCIKCPVRFICNGGCMLVTEEERKNFYCKQRRALLQPMIEELLAIK